MPSISGSFSEGCHEVFSILNILGSGPNPDPSLYSSVLDGSSIPK